jgi:CheY-like chemotaxis protein
MGDRVNQTNPHPQQPGTRNTLGVGGPAYESLLMRLNTEPPDGACDPQRVHTRIPFVDPFVRVVLEEAHGSRREMVLACRNLSRGGVGLLHSSFIYPGTMVTVFIRRPDGSCPGVRGRVARVQHRGGVVHEIGVKFEKEINPRAYSPSDITEAAPSFERVNPQNLRGEVVFVTDSDGLARRLKHYLRETGLNFRFAGTPDAALDEAAGSPQMMLVDMDFGAVAGPELVKKLRVRGFNLPIALIGDPGRGLARSIVRVCGADAVVHTPVHQEELLRVLGEFILSAWDPEQLDRARSKVDRTTIVALCVELCKLGGAMDEQIRVDDRVALFGTCQQIRQIATMVGMNGVASMAERLGEQAADHDDPDGMAELVHQVRLGCAAAGRAAA